MPAITAGTLITDAYALLNVIMLGAAPDARLSAQGLRFLNYMVHTWSQMPLTIPVVARDVFTLTANKGGPSNPYTWGTGGDFTTSKPPNQNSVTGAARILNASSPPVEVPLAILTDTAYQAIQIKDLSNSQPTCLYYNPTFTVSGLGTVNLWPVPNTAVNSLAVYRFQQLASFADLSTIYQVPDGMDTALMFNLAKWIANATGRSLMPETAEIAVTTFAQLQRSNAKMTDMANDLAHNRRAGFNILTGTGGN